MIKRHDFNQAMLSSNATYFKGKIPKLVELLKNNPKNSGNLFNQGYRSIGGIIAIAELKQNVLEVIKVSKDLGINHFRNTLGEDQVNFQLLSEIFEIKTVPTKAYTDPIFWSKCFYTALLAGDRKAINELLAVPEDFMREAQLKCDEVDFAIVRFLKGLYQKNVDLGELLVDALKLTDPKMNDSGRLDYLLYLKFPELNLYRLIFSNNNNQFNIELAEALELHKKFWGNKKNQNASEGWVSIPIICACIIAYESKGYEINVESDYLPKWLIKREY